MAGYKPETGKPKGITAVYNPTDEEERLRQHVYDRKREMGDARTKYIDDNYDKWQGAWEGARPERNKNDWKSNIVIPITSSIIEAELSEINNQDLQPWAVARGSEDQSKAAVMNAILGYTWDTAKSNVAMFDIIKDSLIFGTGIGQEYYWKEPRMVKDEDGKETQVLEYDDSYLEPVSLMDFYVDEKARGFSGPNGARDCVRRYIMDLDDCKSFFDNKKWNKLGNVDKIKAGGDTNYYQYYKPPEKGIKDNEVEVLWYWNKPQDLLVIVANDVVIFMGPNPYKHKQLPFIRVIDVKRPYQFYGKGEAELIESISEENTTLRRMIIDRNHLDMDKPVFVSDTLTLEDEDTIARPHGIVSVGDVNQIKFAEYSDIALSIFKSLEMLEEDKVRVTGMDERQQSVAGAGTATEAAILKEATLKRINLKIWQIKNDTLVDLGKLRVANIMQFYPIPKLTQIMGENAVAKAKGAGTLITEDGQDYEKEFRTIRLKDQAMQINEKTKQPEIVKTKGTTFFEAKPEFFLPTHGGFDITYKATSTTPISKPLEQQKADEMYDRLIMNPTVDPWKLAEFLIESRDKDPDDFKAEQQSPKNQGVSLQKMIDLAGTENDEMLRGNPIGPTPYSSPVHTQIHIDFMRSKKFKETVPPEDKKTIQLFSNHIMGEIMAQKARGAGGAEGASPNGGTAVPPGPGGSSAPPTSMGDVVPDRNMGGGDTDTGFNGPAAITGK
jgi:hypothetical protein